MPSYIEQSLPSMLDSASEKVCFTVIDNKTENSPEIFQRIKPLIDQGKVKRYIQVSNNDFLNSFNRAFTLFPPDNSESFSIFTELDLIVRNTDWIAETREMQSHAILSGFKLSEENYVPPNKGHIDDGISVGFWLMGLNLKVLSDLIVKGHFTSKPFQDFTLRSLFAAKGQMARSASELYHLGWNIWQDDPEYFSRKLNGINWNRKLQSPIEFIYEV